MNKSMSSSRRGYIEGYYGRLLDWQERHHLLSALGREGMSGYVYAPKEDPAHRFKWRDDWDKHWWQEFRSFTKAAGKRKITVIAGIAPGLDFDFSGLAGDGGDMAILAEKAGRLVDAGAGEVVLLMDDLDPGFHEHDGGHDGGYHSEGHAHADLANHLANHLTGQLTGQGGAPVSVVPRLYADEIDPEDETYLSDFSARLDPRIMIWTCGSHVVAPKIDPAATRLARCGIAQERMIIWDNLYANDYCPRRLFLGPWRGRDDAGHIFLNPTGLVHTDSLLLALMAAGGDGAAWKKAIIAHDVPEAFFSISAFFDLPPDPGAAMPRDLFDQGKAAGWLEDLDTLLWRWKSPLQREWYPYLMGLRGDILWRMGEMDALRRHKIFPALLTPPQDKNQR